jgi:hypothetical protein
MIKIVKMNNISIIINMYANCVRCGELCCPNPNNLCNECTLSASIQCICCGNNFFATQRQINHIYGWLGGFFKCKTCQDISAALTSGYNLGIVTVDPNRKITVTYEISGNSCEGGCSEESDEEYDYEEEQKYPILTTINDNDVVAYINNPHVAFSPINYYTVPSLSIHMHCKYTIKNIKIVDM